MNRLLLILIISLAAVRIWSQDAGEDSLSIHISGSEKGFKNYFEAIGKWDLKSETIELNLKKDQDTIEFLLLYYQNRIVVDLENIRISKIPFFDKTDRMVRKIVLVDREGKIEIANDENEPPIRLIYDPANPKSFMDGKNKGYFQLPGINRVEEMVNLLHDEKMYNMVFQKVSF